MSEHFSSFLNMRVVENKYAVWQKPNREHNARKGPPAYHRRIQKKWNKRFGTSEAPAVFIMGAEPLTYLGIEGDKTIIAHPELFAQIRNFAP